MGGMMSKLVPLSLIALVVICATLLAAMRILDQQAAVAILGGATVAAYQAVRGTGGPQPPGGADAALPPFAMLLGAIGAMGVGWFG